ncbi:hypothetical protein [Novosphingobium colocasiae]|uniref:hypothetical protein n=1 Tax=Novosphingobium colocasiae TaxID=1256513 RepID=UPI0035B4B357
MADYPENVLSDYGAAIDSLALLDEVCETVNGVLLAMENEGSSECRPVVVTSLARAARVHLAQCGEALIRVREYCRAADVAHKGE